MGRRARQAATAPPPASGRTLAAGLALLVLALAACAVAHRQDLVTADLGRHVTNGRLLVEEGVLVRTNFYSYTEPDLPVVNHHWGSGLVFYLVERAAGFEGLSVLCVLLTAAGLALAFLAAAEAAAPPLALLPALLGLPLLATRTEVRPEAFSWCLLGLWCFLLGRHASGRLSLRALAPALLVLQVLWVNLHIFFAFGPLLVALAALGRLAGGEADGRRRAARLLALAVACGTACLLNPFGLEGALAPLTIFRDYGYMLAENQSVLFMQRRLGLPVYLWFEVLLAAAVILLLAVTLAGRLRACAAEAAGLAVSGALACAAIRGLPLFALLLVPAAARMADLLLRDRPPGRARAVRVACWWASAGLAAVLLVPGHAFSLRQPTSGLGLLPGTEGAARFLLDNGIRGPIFNNYDIGGYLIHHLHPRERVFVDNRPEAYPVRFFKEVYEPMQSDEAAWRRELTRWDFKAIVFFRLDMTPWAQPFLIRRLRDDAWAPVFVDGRCLVLLRRTPANAELIRRHELPKGMFRAG